MTARGLIGTEIRILGTGVAYMESPETVVFDFGTSASTYGDLHVPSQPGFSSGCRVVIVLGGSVTTPGGSGEDDGLTFDVQDGEDDNGVGVNWGPAVVDDGVRVGKIGHQSITIGLRTRADRPWLRIRGTKSNSAKVVGRAVVLAFPVGC